MGKLASDRTLPGRQALVRDLMASLAPYRAGDGQRAGEAGEAREARRQLALGALHDDMFPLPEPDALAARAAFA